MHLGESATVASDVRILVDCSAASYHLHGSCFVVNLATLSASGLFVVFLGRLPCSVMCV